MLDQCRAHRIPAAGPQHAAWTTIPATGVRDVWFPMRHARDVMHAMSTSHPDVNGNPNWL